MRGRFFISDALSKNLLLRHTLSHFRLRWQSEAATVLSQVQTSNGIFSKRRRASLAAAAKSRDEIGERFKSHVCARLTDLWLLANATQQKQLTFF
jgi:hypothetical protein